MNTRHLLLGFLLAGTAFGLAVRADAQATTQPVLPSVADVQIESLRPYRYAFVSKQTMLAKLQDAIAVLMPRIDAAIGAGLHPTGPVVFTYHGATADQNLPFILDIGVTVRADAPAPAGVTLKTVRSTRCATLLYMGPTSGLPQADGKLYGEIGRRGLQPTDVSREMYLYWEGPDSPNNLIQIQAELMPN